MNLFFIFIEYLFYVIQNLVIRITDEDDPLVYYTSQINNSDFLRVKEEQGLLIEFENFPQQLISLLDLCKQNVM